MTTQTQFARKLFLAFAALSLAFGCSTLLANWLSYGIEARTGTLAASALPSIEHLTLAFDALRDLEAAIDDYPDVAPEQQPAARVAIARLWRRVDKELTTYLSIPPFEGERDLYEEAVPASLRTLDTSAERVFAQMAAHDHAGARLTADHDVHIAANRAADLLRSMIRFNVTHAYNQVNSIATIHRNGARNALALDGIALLFGVVVAFWVLRLFRAHDKLLREHSVAVEQRADELELFGRRVAHDLLSPLSALTYCLSAFKRASDTDPRLHEAMTRARACVLRAQKMVDGIFEFARAGGKPDWGDGADLNEVATQVTEEVLTAEPRERPRVTIEPFERCIVACSPGVLASLLTNLMRNAVKYMSDSALKQITIRVRDDGASALVEIEDTGPGIPEGMEELIFEPYVRAEGVTQPGLGLGLATVKRLSETHGGRVGVRSVQGKGSVFWFTLPKLSTAAHPLQTATAEPVQRAG